MPGVARTPNSNESADEYLLVCCHMSESERLVSRTGDGGLERNGLRSMASRLVMLSGRAAFEMGRRDEVGALRGGDCLAISEVTAEPVADFLIRTDASSSCSSC